MHLFTLLTLSAGTALGASLAKRACGETAARICFGGSSGSTAQDINVDDISYAAAYLRYLADIKGANPLWTMPPKLDCSEWGLLVADAGTVLANHMKPRTNSSLAESFLGACGLTGGMKGVTVNPGDPAYKTPAYLASKAKFQDMIIKLVRAPRS